MRDRSSKIYVRVTDQAYIQAYGQLYDQVYGHVKLQSKR